MLSNLRNSKLVFKLLLAKSMAEDQTSGLFCVNGVKRMKAQSQQNHSKLLYLFYKWPDEHRWLKVNHGIYHQFKTNQMKDTLQLRRCDIIQIETLKWKLDWNTNKKNWCNQK